MSTFLWEQSGILFIFQADNPTMLNIQKLSCACLISFAMMITACSDSNGPVDGPSSNEVAAPGANAAGVIEKAINDEVTTSSHYISAQDGTRLALDVHLPAGRTSSDRHPVLLVLTRYLRSTINPETGEPNPPLNPLDNHFLANGYAIIKVDARGSGASFGTRPAEYGPDEVRDAYDVVEWVVNQGWSDGNVGAFGTSYTGTTAELLAAVNHPAVKAVIPGWSDFDGYASPIRPYGLLASTFISTWGQLVGWMDSGDPQLGAVINPVGGDVEGALLKQAWKDHERNPDVYLVSKNNEYRDDFVGEGVTWAEIGPLHYKAEIERSGVPMLVPVSWMDAGTADGALQRFMHFSNSQKLVIFAGTHGGGGHASPYTVSTEPLPHRPGTDEQFDLRLKFFDHHLKGADNGVSDWPPVRFFNLGEEAFHESEVWPPAGSSEMTLHFSKGGGLTEAGDVIAGTDRYSVDRGVGTGEGNRWMAQMGRPIVNLDDRGAMDERMLTYTTEPFPEGLQITGYPVVSLRMTSDREDGMVLAYLEDVAPDGRSRYLTEGGLRLIHRKTVPNPYFETGRPYHSYTRADSAPMNPGELAEVSFQLWPISALIAPGHRLRLAIAGADAAVFDQLPEEGDINLTVQSGGDDGSTLMVPVIEGRLD
jgi:putative CocE/NonD family hydrolase